jgi:2-iminobutanoate/2-iminopropanoate deaminase
MKRIVHTTKAPEAVGPYSQAVETSGTLYISGQIAIDPVTGKVIEGDIREQTAQVAVSQGSQQKENALFRYHFEFDVDPDILVKLD